MQIIPFRLFVLLVLLFNSFFLQGKSIRADLDFCTFKASEAGFTIIEYYLSVHGSSVLFAETNANKYKGSVFIESEFISTDGKPLVDKFNLVSPEFGDSVSFGFTLKVQKRFLLKNGNWKFKLKIKDNNSPESKFSEVEKEFTLGFEENLLAISDIQLLEKFSKAASTNEFVKSGYELIPYVGNFFPSGKDSLSFYCEIYNTNKVLDVGSDFLVSYSINNVQSGRVIGKFTGYSKKKANPVIPILNAFDISKLPSGNYQMTVAITDRTNKPLLNKSIFFQRSNKSVDETISAKEQEAYVNLAQSFVTQYDEPKLNTYIAWLNPIYDNENKHALDNILINGTLTDKQKFFHSFWVRQSPTAPEMAWNDYLLRINYVNDKYKVYPLAGYETDRGRVFLKYGPPKRIANNQNDLERESRTLLDPYEIWHYYKAGNQSNRIFVFHQRNLASTYDLIHSDVTGEITNYQWQKDLNKLNNQDPEFRDKTFDKSTYSGDR